MHLQVSHCSDIWIHLCCEVIMFPWWLLGFLALCPASLCTNPGITGRITQNGLEYGKFTVYSWQSEKSRAECTVVKHSWSTMHHGNKCWCKTIIAIVWSCFHCDPSGRQIGMAVLQQKLKSIKIPDMSGKEKVSPIGKVRYSLTEWVSTISFGSLG